MPHYKTQKVLPFTQKQLFDMVLDVDQYQEFLPWCRRSEVIDHLPDQEKLYASVTAGYMIYREMYVSKVTYKNHKRIKAVYVDGPFSNLETIWQFDPHEEGCDLSFEIHFEFSKGVLNTLANHVLDQISTTMVGAFIKRAETLYSQKELE